MSGRRPRKKRRRSTESSPDIPTPGIARRAMEKTMSDIGKLLSEQEFDSIEEANAFLQQALASGQPLVPSSEGTPLEQAQDLMYEAWEASGSRRRVKLARQALEISEDCADAYVLLAESAGRLKEARDLYEKGVKAGERALGPEAFEENVGYFWGVTETRPYMRARLGLARCLWSLGEREEAIEHYTDMLRLNPGDNQGIRYILVNCLLEEGDDEALGELLKQYEEDIAAAWLYGRALWTFRQEGASKKANACLKEAMKRNRFVPSYLLGKKRLPVRLPGYVGLGDETEAMAYAVEAIKVWNETEGALEWLTENRTKGGG